MENKKHIFENDLIIAIKNNEIKLENAIMHRDLSVSLRNESKYLIDFLFTKKKLKKLIDYALFDKKSKTKEYSSVRQINNNAANILSYPSDRIKKKIVDVQGNDSKPLLLEKFEEFIKKKELYTDPYYAGHFERIYESILRYDKLFFDDFDEELIPFLAKNITILPYQELFQVLLEDFAEEIGEEKTNFAIKTILQYATYYSCVLFCNSSQKNSIFTSNQQLRKYFKKHQPINKYKKEIPVPQFIYYDDDDDEDEDKYKRIAIEKGKKFFPEELKNKNPDREIQKDELETILMKTYFFISCIFGACYGNNDFSLLKKDNFLEMILYCGIFSDPESLSSMEAFRILDRIYYGSLDDYDAPYQSEGFLKAIDEYAEFISFDHTTLSILEINAFPIFWNHRYEYKKELNKKCLIDIDSVLNINQSFECDEKQTPFLILRPFLFADPPISNKLIFSYITIFHYLDYLRKKITEENDKPIDQYSTEDQKKIKEIDLTVYEFIQRPFPYFIGERNNKYKFCNFYQALDNVIPYFPKSDIDSSNENQIRAALNGSSFEICQIFLHSSFFIINNEVSELLFEINRNFTSTSNSVIDVLQHFSREINITTNKKESKVTKKINLHEFSDDEDDEDDL